jgi:ribosomal protein S18 acetylase RimI-like enzyme
MFVRREIASTDADLRAMQSLAERIWRVGAGWHIGDIPWGRRQHTGRDAEWRTMLWELDGQVVGWGWVRLPGHLDLLVDPAHAGVADEILEWFPTVATADELSVTTMSTEPHLQDALRRAGFVETEDDHLLLRYHHDLRELAEPKIPEGFTLRPLAGDEDVEQRVEVHRSAFHPSRVTTESYAAVRGSWPYRQDLDWVVEAPDGRFAASCLIWWDERNRNGELEPVGAHQDFRRLGLAQAACLGALHRLRELGAQDAVVMSVGDPTKPAARGLYLSLGFVDHCRTLKFVRPRVSA